MKVSSSLDKNIYKCYFGNTHDSNIFILLQKVSLHILLSSCLYAGIHEQV